MLPFDPEAGMVEGEARPIASAVMSCEGKSELQFYRGSRSMVILSHKAWSVKVGGTDPAALEQDKIRLAEIGFPPNSMVLLEFANGMLHGFEGDFGAISTHCIDGWDRVWLPWEHPGATPQDLIRKRTISVDPGKLDVIGGTRIPYQVIQELQALEATRAAESAEHLDAVIMLLPL
jgi:hypothetical protein